MTKFYAVISLMLLWLISTDIYCQKYKSDSLILDFGISQKIIDLQVDSIIDNRQVYEKNILRISERKRYIFIPVDFYYLVNEPLQKKIQSLFKKEIQKDTAYVLRIERFELSYSDLKPLPLLIAQIDVFQKNGDGKLELKGTLVYETLGKKVKKNKEKEAFESLIEDWIHVFEKDLLRITGNQNIESPKVSNYYPAPLIARQRIFSKISYQYQFNTYSIEANIGFYDPEPGARFRRQTSYLLYVNDVRFESIAFGRKAYQDYLRISPNWILNLELRYGLGLNRWKDFYSYDHTLYDIVNFNIGVKGGIFYYPFAKRSFFAGINLSSDLFYIYSMNVFERYGLGFSLGLNF